MRRWQVQARETVFEHPLFRLETRRLVPDPPGATGPGRDRRDAVVLATPNWVNVIPLLSSSGEEDRVLLVRQFRYGLERMTLEIPGGVVEDGEAEQPAVARELLEETGYEAGTWRRLGEVHPNPAYQNNHLGTWLATDLVRVGEAEGDGDEELEVESVALSEIPGLIAGGTITHTLVISAFYLLGLDPQGRKDAP